MLARLLAYLHNDCCLSLYKHVPKGLSLTNRAKIAEIQKVNKIHAHATKWLQLDSNSSTCELRLHACNSQTMENGNKKSNNSR